MTATNDADTTIRKVEQIDHQVGDHGGAQGAYTELKKEYDQYASTHSAGDTQNYWNNVTSKLQQDNVLPDLAVAWGKENFNNFSSDGSKLNAYSLDTPFRYGTNNAQENFDKTFATNLKDHMGDLTALQGGIHPFGWWKDNSDITQGELNTYLDNQTKNNKTAADQQNARTDMGPLFNTYTGPDGHQQSLMQVLDGDRTGGQSDGYVSSGDMQRFLDDYNRFTENGQLTAPKGSPYTKANADYVKNILDGKNKTVGADGFNVNQLAKKGGFDNVPIDNNSDYNKVVSEFNAKQPDGKKTTDTTPNSPDNPNETTANGITKDGDKVTKIQYPDGSTRTFGYDSSGNLNGATFPDGSQYHKQGDKWYDAQNHPAKFNDMNVDGNGNVNFSFDNGVKFSIKPDDSTVLTDGAGNATQRDGKTHRITEEDNANGNTEKFGYDTGGRLNSVTLPDGTQYNYDGRQWTDQNGQKSDIQNFNLNQRNGALTYDKGRDHYSVAEDGTVLKNGKADAPVNNPGDNSNAIAADQFGRLPQDVQNQIRQQVLQQLADTTAANRNDGYISIAARMLGVSSSDPKAYELFKQMAEANHAKPPYRVLTGQHLLTPDTLMKVAEQNADLRKVMEAAMAKATTAYVKQHPGSDPETISV